MISRKICFTTPKKPQNQYFLKRDPTIFFHLRLKILGKNPQNIFRKKSGIERHFTVKIVSNKPWIEDYPSTKHVSGLTLYAVKRRINQKSGRQLGLELEEARIRKCWRKRQSCHGDHQRRRSGRRGRDYPLSPTLLQEPPRTGKYVSPPFLPVLTPSGAAVLKTISEIEMTFTVLPQVSRHFLHRPGVVEDNEMTEDCTNKYKNNRAKMNA